MKAWLIQKKTTNVLLEVKCRALNNCLTIGVAKSSNAIPSPPS